ncbi:MAG: iron-containing alcohol dehydrogenase [Gammaproteobacteria bacterium]|nr:iron-containing alcohol dehydrogenase [Gammaproteobacteria bacterium]
MRGSVPPPVDWNYPTAIRFGAGRAAEAAAACAELGMRRPLLVVDPAVRDLAAAVRVAALPGGAVFSDVQGNPAGAHVAAGVKAFTEGGHDGVVAMGGGSALDIGKAVALMAGQRRPLWDFEDREDWWRRAEAGAIKPVVALPTTAGTGSETGRAAVIMDERDRTKKIIFHPLLMPGRVLLDPELTAGLPPGLTAAAGMDALSHSLEAWCSPVYHPLAEGIALRAMKLIQRSLPAVFRDGADLAARAHMQVAGMMGSTAFQKGLGLMHSLSHPCSSLFGTHHGLTNAVVMPYVLAFQRRAVAAKLESLAAYLELEGGAGGVVDWVLDLRRELEIPHTLAELGVAREEIPRMAHMALADPSTATSPVRVTADDLEKLYAGAMAGDI